MNCWTMSFHSGSSTLKILSLAVISAAWTAKEEVFDTDKFIWLQGREVWMFSMLYNKVEKRQEWLDCAVQGGEFLKKYGHDGRLQLVLFTRPFG